MKIIKKDDKLTLQSYARYNNLLEIPKWKWARCLTKNPKKFNMTSKIFSAQTKRHNIKYKYGVKVTRKVKEAIKFNNENDNTLC